MVTHPAAIASDLCHIQELLAEAPAVELVALFGPEHGFLGEAQDLIGVSDGVQQDSGPRIYSLYGNSYESLKPNPQQLRGLDALVIDLQDVGSRYYTFVSTMFFCLEAAAENKLLAVVLDRPNPVGGAAVEGPVLQSHFASYVGLEPVCTRHGMTMGELAQWYRKRHNLSGEFQIIPCEGLKRNMYFEQTGLPWVLPSPNMPTVETAVVYPGQCLIEGTNLSEGRGTTRPFELSGAPWIDPHALAKRLLDEKLPGVVFRPAWFRPTFQKFAGQNCGGVQMHVTDREAFQPVRASLALLAAMRDLSGDRFDWRRTPYEFVSDRLAIDLLFGNDRERLALEAGKNPREISQTWEAEEAAFRKQRAEFLLYS
ncbi:MAG TPA: DUF1343 domain-containing protein [Gemmataceae bacterium]|nr:DUF1343 domain-containing protein [Gemmataceae bacterium]